MRSVMSVVLAGLVLVGIVLTLAWVLQRRLMYFPLAGVPAPESVGLDQVDPVRFTTADGLAIEGWFVRGRRIPARATVIVFNGNAGNRAYRAPLAAALRAQGCNVLLFDYRGYGGNSGAPTETGLAADARAARTYVATRRDVDPDRIVYFGESLGAAVAATLATENPPAALILRSPFTSMADIGSFHYPFLPVRRLLRDRFATIDRIANVRAPLLVIAGDRDTIVPVVHSQRLYAAAASPKAFVTIRDADHNDDALLAGPELIEAVVRFLESTEHAPAPGA